MNNREKSRHLRALIRAEKTLVMPDAFDPMAAIFSAIRAMTETLQSIRETEDFAEILGANRLCGMEDIAALLKRE